MLLLHQDEDHYRAKLLSVHLENIYSMYLELVEEP